MELLDSRRLTGSNVIWERPGAVIDVAFDAEDADTVIRLWQRNTRSLMDALGWQDEALAVHRYPYGASLALSAPIDALYVATDVNDAAWEATVAGMDAAIPADAFENDVERLRAILAHEQRPALIALREAAVQRGHAFLSDDEQVSIGLGSGARVWPRDDLPSPEAVPWQDIGEVPVALITGTNGKTTSARLAAAIGHAAGHTVGLSSTDCITVAGELIARGDYSGPGGARTVLRHPQVDLAILETARGGLLRRGLGVERADAALITNIADDHLGDFGSRSRDELLEVKWIVTHALGERPLVLNADDRRLRERAGTRRCRWFSIEPDGAHTRALVERGDRVWTERDAMLGVVSNSTWTPVVAVTDIPLTLDGAARHNVANALAAAALCDALGISPDHIAQGLISAQRDDNPGRCNLFDVEGVRVLVDYAHNPQGMRALCTIARALGKARTFLSIGQPGDRPDEAMRDFARAAWEIRPERIGICELERVRRGREPGEIYQILREELLRAGAPRSSISYHPDEVAALDEALAWAQRGDLIVVLALTDALAVIDRLRTAR